MVKASLFHCFWMWISALLLFLFFIVRQSKQLSIHTMTSQCASRSATYESEKRMQKRTAVPKATKTRRQEIIVYTVYCTGGVARSIACNNGCLMASINKLFPSGTNRSWATKLCDASLVSDSLQSVIIIMQNSLSAQLPYCTTKLNKNLLTKKTFLFLYANCSIV